MRRFPNTTYSNISHGPISRRPSRQDKNAQPSLSRCHSCGISACPAVASATHSRPWSYCLHFPRPSLRFPQLMTFDFEYDRFSSFTRNSATRCDILITLAFRKRTEKINRRRQCATRLVPCSLSQDD